MSTVVRKKAMYFIHWIIVLTCMLFFRYLPTWGEVTPYGMQILGIFVGLMWGWIFLDFLAPSLLAFIILVLFVNGATIDTICAQGLGSQNIFMMILVLTLAQYFEASGLNKFLANWFVSRKINVGRPWLFSTILMIAAFFFSVFTQTIAAMLLMWMITFSIADRVKMPKKHKWIAFMIVGICLAGSYGSVAVPWQIMGLVFLASMTETIGITINMGLYCLVMVLFSLAAIILYALVGKYILRLDVSSIENKEDLYANMRKEKMNIEQKRAFMVMLLFVVLMLSPNFLPTNWPIISQLYTLSVTGSTIIILLSISLFRDKKTGDEAYNLSKLFSKSVQWDLIIMCAMVFPLVNMLESDEAGVVSSVVDIITPIIGGFSPTICIIVTALLLGVATQVFHNMMLGLIFIPIGCTLMAEMGGSPVVMTLAISAALLTSFLTPAASTQSAMMFGNTKMAEKNDLFIYAGISVIVGLLCMAFVLVPISNLIW